MKTKTDWLPVLEKLADMIQEWNDAEEEPDERARGNNLLCLVLAEDGSGVVGTVDHAPERSGIWNFFDFSDWYDPRRPMHLNGSKFSNLEELATVLSGEGTVDWPPEFRTAKLRDHEDLKDLCGYNPPTEIP